MQTNRVLQILLLFSLVMTTQIFLLNAQSNKAEPWCEGYLDIHHISTGRGNSTFLVFPDGTSMIIDCGDMSSTHERVMSDRNTPIVPDDSKSIAQWVADYIHQFHPDGKKACLDYALITHYHDDHFGEVDSLREKHKKGGYLMTGITELGSIIPIKKIIDRGYDFPINFKDEKVQESFIKADGDDYSMIGTLKAYWRYIDYHAENNGLVYETFKVGTNRQFVLNHKPQNYKNFVVKNLFANGEVCTNSEGETYRNIQPGVYKGENELSTGIRISYGEFDYYTGGDIGGLDGFGQNDPKSMETITAPVIGPVDVAVLNHHGNRGSMNTFFVSTLRPSVWIQPTWSADHPGSDVLRRLISRDLYPGDRDVYSNAMLYANRLVIGGIIDRAYKSTAGHILVRVYPDGDSFSVIILDDLSSNREVKAVYDYKSKPLR